MVAIQKVNCPFCNEPVAKTVLRSDFVPRGSGVSKRCRGDNPPGESLDLEMTRHEWQEVEPLAAPPNTLREAQRKVLAQV